jgi:hypothetical protein
LLSYKQRYLQFLKVKIPPAFSSSSTTNFNYSQNSVKGYFWTNLMRWIRLYYPFYHSNAGCWATSGNISNFWE